MRRSRSSIAIHAFAAVLLVASCCVGLLPATAQEALPAIHAQAQPSEQSPDLATLFDAVTDAIDQKFFDVALLKKIDWRARAEAVRPTVLSAASTEDAVRQINALLSELKTSHTRLFTPDEYDYYALLDIVGVGPDNSDLMPRRFWGGLYYPGIGAFTLEMDGHHFVDGILEGSPAEQAGLKYGDEILSVDGKPYSPIAVFRGKVGTFVDLRIRRSSQADPQRLDALVIPIRPTNAFPPRPWLVPALLSATAAASDTCISGRPMNRTACGLR